MGGGRSRAKQLLFSALQFHLNPGDARRPSPTPSLGLSVIVGSLLGRRKHRYISFLSGEWHLLSAPSCLSWPCTPCKVPVPALPFILPGLEICECLSQVLNFPKAGNWAQANF